MHRHGYKGRKFGRETDQRRYRRRTAVLHGTALSEPFDRRIQLPWTEGTDPGAGHGKDGAGTGTADLRG